MIIIYRSKDRSVVSSMPDKFPFIIIILYLDINQKLYISLLSILRAIS